MARTVRVETCLDDGFGNAHVVFHNITIRGGTMVYIPGTYIRTVFDDRCMYVTPSTERGMPDTPMTSFYATGEIQRAFERIGYDPTAPPTEEGTWYFDL